ncbi:hypothetical protein [Sulfobacillus harzensis]|uniref:Urease accessory protein UreH-like transmembrane domain-containing protein n=1 Tax=Sulfobacillus harzensis TaxID=2729629 RepID=A0A7Y0L3E4_9FIRM|nr:hypothetical protein [Sulfobacillus harzensis]NMP21675.1 hypothetical protein [Sulfobacillus harzensis]
MPNLWEPHAGLAVGAVLLTAVLLGMVHGITPDEHTWPITFSYAIGSYSTKTGVVRGLTFSASFTLQRALASELAYLALDRWLRLGSALNYSIYVVVGIAMIWAARAIFRGQHWHLFAFGHNKAHSEPELHDAAWWMPIVHGFIAGWGFGAFAIIIYTVLAPSMPSAWLAWLPGLAFGVGTTLIQAAAGGLFGWLSRHLGLNQQDVRTVSLKTAGNTLGLGGLIFFLAGAFGLLFPKWANFSVATGLHIHNLAHLGLPTILVMVTVVVIGVGTLITETHRLASSKAKPSWP